MTSTTGSRGKAGGRGNTSANAILVIDFVNPLLETNARAYVDAALQAAQHSARLLRQAERERIPVIYANDNFGNWQSNFPSLLAACGGQSRAGEIVSLLQPAEGDYTVLKPRHSAFYGTPLEFLLDELEVRRLIMVGIETDICVMHTANDAYMRKFELWVPGNCTASRAPSGVAAALQLMKRNLKADTWHYRAGKGLQ